MSIKRMHSDRGGAARFEGSFPLAYAVAMKNVTAVAPVASPYDSS